MSERYTIMYRDQSFRLLPPGYCWPLRLSSSRDWLERFYFVGTLLLPSCSFNYSRNVACIPLEISHATHELF